MSEKAADAWEELFIDAYNGTGRGTRMYGVEAFKTLPIVWNVGAERPRGHTRSIRIAFQRHDDEPEANILFARMSRCRDSASRSVGRLIQMSKSFECPGTKDLINRGKVSPKKCTSMHGLLFSCAKRWHHECNSTILMIAMLYNIQYITTRHNGL